jgi:hypothetical protein
MAPDPGEASRAMATVVQVYAQTGVASRCGVAVRGAASGITRAAVFAGGETLSPQGQLYAGARRGHRGAARRGGCRRSPGASAGGSEGTEVYAQTREWTLPGGRSTEWGGAEAGEVPGAFRRLDRLRGGELPADMAVCSGRRRWPSLAEDSNLMLAGSSRGRALFSSLRGVRGGSCFHAHRTRSARNGPPRRVPGLRAARFCSAAAITAPGGGGCRGGAAL